jgi:hypothetical protein
LRLLINTVMLITIVELDIETYFAVIVQMLASAPGGFLLSS